MIQELLDRVRKEQEHFPAAQRLVAAYVVENYNQIPFLSITTLAKNIGVSDNTVVKFCNHLGYNKFAEFKKVFSDYAHSELVMTNKLSENTGRAADDDSFFTQELEESMAAVQATLLDTYNQKNLPKLLEMMDRAEHIYVTGGRGSSMMAGLLAKALRYLNLKVHDLIEGMGDHLDQVAMIGPKDLAIIISLPRYTAQVVDAAKYLHKAGVPVVLITDTGLSPAHPYADLSFHCTMTSSYYFPSFTGCLALINTICRAAGATRNKETVEYTRKLERELLDRGIFL